jgi:hypothetical protein
LACRKQNTPKPVHGFSNLKQQGNKDLLVLSRSLTNRPPNRNFLLLFWCTAYHSRAEVMLAVGCFMKNVFLETTNTNMIKAIE